MPLCLLKSIINWVIGSLLPTIIGHHYLLYGKERKVKRQKEKKKTLQIQNIS